MNLRMGRFGDAYAAEIRAFIGCTLEDRAPSAPRVSGEDAHKATTIGRAATLLLDEVPPIMLREVE